MVTVYRQSDAGVSFSRPTASAADTSMSIIIFYYIGLKLLLILLLLPPATTGFIFQRETNVRSPGIGIIEPELISLA